GCTTRRLPHSSGTLQGPIGAPPRSARPKSPRPPRRSVRGRSGAPRFPARVPAARGSGTTALRPPLSESRDGTAHGHLAARAQESGERREGRRGDPACFDVLPLSIVSDGAVRALASTGADSGRTSSWAASTAWRSVYGPDGASASGRSSWRS